MRENVLRKKLGFFAICLSLVICAICMVSAMRANARDAAPEQGWTRYEAENGKIVPIKGQGGRFEENAPSASGGKAWVDINSMGATLILKVTVPEMGMYPVRLFGATGQEHPSMRLWNEASYCIELVFNDEKGWGNYAEDLYAQGQIPLMAGENLLLLRKGNMAVQVDALDVGAKSGAYVLPEKDNLRGIVCGEETKYELEDALYIVDGKAEDSPTSASGIIISDFDDIDSKVVVPVMVDEDGEYVVKVKYASGHTEPVMKISANGIFATEIIGDGATADWGDFSKYMTTNVMLKAGINIIEVGKGRTNIEADDSACLDYMTISNAKTATPYVALTPDSTKYSFSAQAGWTRFEAEAAVTNNYNMINQKIFDYISRGNTGYGYISDMQHGGAQITFNLPNVPEAGEYAVKLRYASKNATSSFICTVNNGATVNFNSTSNEDTQDKFVVANTISANVTLAEGANTLKFTQGVDGGATNMEQFDGIDVNYVMASVGIDTSSVKTTLAKGIDILDISLVTAVKVTSDLRKQVLSDGITVVITDSESKVVETLGQDAALGVYNVRFTAAGYSKDVEVTVAAVTANINTDAVTTAFEKTSALTIATMNAEIEKAIFEITTNGEKHSYPFNLNKWTYTLKKGAETASTIAAGTYTAEITFSGTTIKKSFDLVVYEAKSAAAVTTGITLNLDYGKKVSDLEAIIKGAKLNVTMNNGTADSTKEFAYNSNVWTYAVAKGTENVSLSDKNAVLTAGDYTITLTYTNNTNIKATFNVTVAANVVAKSIKLNKTQIELAVNGTLDLSEVTVTLVKSDDSEELLIDTAFIVDKSKVDTAKAGTYEVIFTYKDDPTITVKLNVTVVAAKTSDPGGCKGSVASNFAGGGIVLLVIALCAILVVRKKKNHNA